MKTTKFVYAVKNTKGKYLTASKMRTSNIAKALTTTQYEAQDWVKYYNGFGKSNKVVKIQITTTIKEVRSIA